MNEHVDLGPFMGSVLNKEVRFINSIVLLKLMCKDMLYINYEMTISKNRRI